MTFSNLIDLSLFRWEHIQCFSIRITRERQKGHANQICPEEDLSCFFDNLQTAVASSLPFSEPLHTRTGIVLWIWIVVNSNEFYHHHKDIKVVAKWIILLNFMEEEKKEELFQQASRCASQVPHAQYNSIRADTSKSIATRHFNFNADFLCGGTESLLIVAVSGCAGWHHSFRIPRNDVFSNYIPKGARNQHKSSNQIWHNRLK